MDQQKKILQECQPKSTKDLALEVIEEYKIFFNLLSSNGFTGIEDNYKVREMLNRIICEIRKMQDFMIKVSAKNTMKLKVQNAIGKKLKASKNEDDEDEVKDV
jgi:tryptophan synthase alpha subunit